MFVLHLFFFYFDVFLPRVNQWIYPKVVALVGYLKERLVAGCELLLECLKPSKEKKILRLERRIKLLQKELRKLKGEPEEVPMQPLILLEH